MSDINKASAFDPAAAVNAIREKIRGQVLDVIPSEQWDALIRSEMKSFMEDQVENKGSYNEKVIPAAFKIIVRSILSEEAEKIVKGVMNGNEWSSVYDSSNQRYKAGEAIRKLLIENGPAIMETYMKDQMAIAFQGFITNLKNTQRY